MLKTIRTVELVLAIGFSCFAVFVREYDSALKVFVGWHVVLVATVSSFVIIRVVLWKQRKDTQIYIPLPKVKFIIRGLLSEQFDTIVLIV